MIKIIFSYTEKSHYLRVFRRAPVYMLTTAMLEKKKQEWDFSPHRPLLTIQAALG